MPKKTKLGGGTTKEKGWKYSSFFVTVNTNRTPEEIAPYKLDEVMDYIIDNEDVFYTLIKGYDDTIDKTFAEVEYTVEVGGKYHRLHTHFFVKMRHRGRISINIDRLRNIFEKKLNIVGIKIHIKGMGASGLTLKQYMDK